MKTLLRTTLSFLLLTASSVIIAADAQAPAAAAADKPRVEMVTSKGTMIIELYPDKAPKTVENFLQYVKDGAYDGTIFHRVIRNFMNQGGGFTEDFTKVETREPIQNEADNGLKNLKYTVAMARTSAPHSATNQFFINTKDNDFLNHTGKSMRGWGYTVFGKVVEGQNVADIISRVATGSGGPFDKDVPRTTITIEKMSLVK